MLNYISNTKYISIYETYQHYFMLLYKVCYMWRVFVNELCYALVGKPKYIYLFDKKQYLCSPPSISSNSTYVKFPETMCCIFLSSLGNLRPDQSILQPPSMQVLGTCIIILKLGIHQLICCQHGHF